jgi:hypothetical protein
MRQSRIAIVTCTKPEAMYHKFRQWQPACRPLQASLEMKGKRVYATSSGTLLLEHDHCPIQVVELIADVASSVRDQNLRIHGPQAHFITGWPAMRARD